MGHYLSVLDTINDLDRCHNAVLLHCSTDSVKVLHSCRACPQTDGCLSHVMTALRRVSSVVSIWLVATPL